MKTESKIEKYLNGNKIEEQTGKGFTITCDKCGETVRLLRDNKLMPTNSKLDIMPGAEEDSETGGSNGYVNFNCNRCKQSMVVDE